MGTFRAISSAVLNVHLKRANGLIQTVCLINGLIYARKAFVALVRSGIQAPLAAPASLNITSHGIETGGVQQHMPDGFKLNEIFTCIQFSTRTIGEIIGFYLIKVSEFLSTAT